MATARKDILDENNVRTYHCMSRCVRRAFLCGFDNFTQKTFDYRKEWVRKRVKFLIKTFFIDVGAYAILSNHLHLILRTRPDLVKNLSDEEILEKWNTLFPSFDKSGKPIPLSKSKIKMLLVDKERINELRKRLSSVSWFMRCLNEHIARKANKEDKCKGRFWEGRFKCQLLLGEGAVITTMVYVDLNPIRAKLTETLEDSEFTSIQERLLAYGAEERLKLISAEEKKSLNTKQKELLDIEQATVKSVEWLSPIEEDFNRENNFINMDLTKYIELVEWTGRQIHKKKRGKIPDHLAATLERYEINNERWVKTINKYNSIFYRVIGKCEDITEQAKNVGKKCFQGLTENKLFFT